MEYVKLFFTNRILISGLLGWAVAQVLKTIIYMISNKKLRIERLFGDGGMPSGHSATVTAVALSTGLTCGFDSAVFAFADDFHSRRACCDVFGVFDIVIRTAFESLT